MSPDEIVMRYMDVQCPWCGQPKGTWCTYTENKKSYSIYPDIHSVRIIAYEDQLLGGASKITIINHQRRVVRFED